MHRKKFLQDHIAQVLLAKKEGVKVNGYFVWSFMDNFEWAEGFYPRFGIVYVDFPTQKRIIKSSGLWYSEFLRNETSSIIEVMPNNGTVLRMAESNRET